MLDIIVLGAAAGGGFPQWNSNAPGCNRARAQDPTAPARTQASLAVSGDGTHWYVLNASPDLRTQINQTPALHPKTGLRSTPISGVVLTSGEIDTITGLLTMREKQAFDLYAAAPVLAQLDANPIFEALDRTLVPRHSMALEQPLALTPAGFTITPFAVPGKVPLYAEQGNNPAEVKTDGEFIGLDISDGTRHAFFIPGCAMMTDALSKRLDGADLVFFDGTLWTDDEMVRAGLGAKTGKRMGHMSIADEPDGTRAAFTPLTIGRKILIHINNSNPILLADSPERRDIEQAGWDVAFDGMRVTL
ncbi:pyrroloquinoline quinone biosynthesis protein PqqB [Acetobacter cibinongensis]|uniref:Coenzyme PQQ synthesis protein B n=1 Tax=Acetobacter cibinongensis TaxID=146475 RepID=A0A1Z5YXN3_9PROT|nr:pyrroloquinoline quinone biosynthesis protein PqqB [Acetobacter cibinongensis]OUJ04064.1 pyrroloquinoline quinone biosynthesis protein PqqB [Acetobacter cibinongensis]GAN60422.1 pyrroloquinoline quinone (PQQ) biosynthesis protein PqqB [Acetobacter cibinongensis]GBQ18585.1 pyrroloquinoline quinone biosynthesis protein PqqB [Acetobacter cibinongensis NRIC 0482]GEL58126.1 coenzyme PQQ synthesis protein B [Acetobacter cibinongensis]